MRGNSNYRPEPSAKVDSKAGAETALREHIETHSVYDLLAVIRDRDKTIGELRNIIRVLVKSHGFGGTAVITSSQLKDVQQSPVPLRIDHIEATKGIVIIVGEHE